MWLVLRANFNVRISILTSIFSWTVKGWNLEKMNYAVNIFSFINSSSLAHHWYLHHKYSLRPIHTTGGLHSLWSLDTSFAMNPRIRSRLLSYRVNIDKRLVVRLKEANKSQYINPETFNNISLARISHSFFPQHIRPFHFLDLTPQE